MAGTEKRRVAFAGPAALALGLVLALGGCGDDDEPTEARDVAATTAPPTTTGGTEPDPTSTSTTGPAPTSTTEGPGTPSTPTTAPAPGPGGLALTQRCTVAGRFSVAFPEGWHTNASPAPDLCAWFGPDPITVPEFGTDAVLAPINLRVQVRDLSVPTTEAVEAERTTTVDGRTAVRRELRTTEDLLLPAGTRLTTWEVVVGDRPEGGSDVLTGVVIDGRTGTLSYGEAVAALDAMVPTVDLDA